MHTMRTIAVVVMSMFVFAHQASAQHTSTNIRFFQEIYIAASEPDGEDAWIVTTFHARSSVFLNTFSGAATGGAQNTSTEHYAYWRFLSYRCTSNGGPCETITEEFGNDGHFQVSGSLHTFTGGGYQVTLTKREGTEVGLRIDPYYERNPYGCTNNRNEWSPFIEGEGALTTADGDVYDEPGNGGTYRFGFGTGSFSCPTNQTGGKG